MDDAETLGTIRQRALERLGLRPDEWMRAAVDGRLDRAEQLAALLLILDTPPSGRGPGRESAREQAERRTMARLGRRTLPWDSRSARFALVSVGARDEWDPERVLVALRGAESVVSAGGADAELLSVLSRAGDWFLRLEAAYPLGLWKLAEYRSRVERIIASTTPIEFVDLSIVRTGDGWGAPARDIAHSLPPHEIAPLVRQLGALARSGTPPQRWLGSVAELVGSPGSRRLVVAWLEQAVEASRRPAPWPLFDSGNEKVLRATALAAQFVPGGSISSLLELVAMALERRSPLVAGAAIASLERRGTPDDRASLESLLGTLRSRILIRRVGRAVDREAEGIVRAEEVRIENLRETARRRRRR